MRVLQNLEPKKVFEYFEEIASIPHGSRNTKQISDYLVEFAKSHNLEHYQDATNDVTIIKEATAGYENADPIIIQGHMDMVCEKENDVDIDFEKDGLNLYIDGDFVKAKGTTLGGDDGVAVAYALAILDSDEIAHPRLEVIITVDEEIGMIGAFDIELPMIKGRMMLNIDSDEEGIFLTSCAGGASVNGSIPVSRTTQSGVKCDLVVGGLFGGHSGSEIDKEHGNADILMGRVLAKIFEETPFGIISLNGGLKDNAIPRECKAQILLPEESVEIVTSICEKYSGILKKEFSIPDPEVFVSLNVGSVSEELDFASVNKIVYFLRTTPNGVINMSKIMPGLVETSLNLGKMNLNEDSFDFVTSIRSSVSSRKEDLKDRLVMLVNMLGGEVTIDGEYPAWEYKADSKLREKIQVTYKELYGKDPVFEAIHAGLECGIFSDKLPGLDCVSFGPNNVDIHTPKERLSIEAANRDWNVIVGCVWSRNTL